MKPLLFGFACFSIGALVTAVGIYSMVGHYRDPQQYRNMGYLDTQHDILIELEKHFGSEGVFPDSQIQDVEVDNSSPVVFTLKTSVVQVAKKDGIPTIYINP